MLTERYSATAITELLLPFGSYHPFPRVTEREAWDSVPEDLRTGILEQGQCMLDAGWPPLPATLFLRYTREGNRDRYEQPYFKRRSQLATLTLAECLHGEGRFLDEIVNGVWTLCEESSWVLPAHCRTALPSPEYTDLDIFSAETGALVAWCYYLLEERLNSVTPVITTRLRYELRRRILDPFLEHTDYWWMGIENPNALNNWSPWCASNCLSVALLQESDVQKRTQAVAKSMLIIDRFLSAYHPDGGCDEGPGYWGKAGASLFDYLELLYSASNGAIDLYSEPLIREIGRYIQRVHISGAQFINFADASALVTIPASLVYRYGRRIDDPSLAAFGAAAFRVDPRSDDSTWSPLFRTLPTLFLAKELRQHTCAPMPLRDVWLDGIQVMAAREAESEDGFYLAAKGGHNAESHNHNDVGQFVLYSDGHPVFIDIGVETYTRKTFSEQRYEIWTMQSAYHNLPTVNGIQQAPGSEFHAADVVYNVDDTQAELSLDIAAAYPAEAGITSWRRTCRLLRGEKAAVEIVDDFTLAQPSADIRLSLLTPREPQLTGAGSLTLPDASGDIYLMYDPALTATVERLPVADAQLRRVWGDHLFRITLAVTEATKSACWMIIIKDEC